MTSVARMGKQITLLYFPTSFYSQKARLCLEEKGIQYKADIKNLYAGETYLPAYMKINPKGQVPVMKIGDQYIPDSQKIAEYLEKNFEDTPKLLPDPSTEDGAAMIELANQLRDITEYKLSFGAQIYPELAQDSEIAEKDRQYTLDTMAPEKQKAALQNFEDLANANPDLHDVYMAKKESHAKRLKTLEDKQNVVNEIKKCQTVFKLAEKQLQKNVEAGKKQHWLVGDQHLTLNDIECGILMRRLKTVGLSKSTWEDGKHPHVEKYFERLNGRQTFHKISVLQQGGDNTIKEQINPTMLMAVIGAVLGVLAFFMLMSN